MKDDGTEVLLFGLRLLAQMGDVALKHAIAGIQSAFIDAAAALLKS